MRKKVRVMALCVICAMLGSLVLSACGNNGTATSEEPAKAEEKQVTDVTESSDNAKAVENVDISGFICYSTAGDEYVTSVEKALEGIPYDLSDKDREQIRPSGDVYAVFATKVSGDEYTIEGRSLTYSLAAGATFTDKGEYSELTAVYIFDDESTAQDSFNAMKKANDAVNYSIDGNKVFGKMTSFSEGAATFSNLLESAILGEYEYASISDSGKLTGEDRDKALAIVGGGGNGSNMPAGLIDIYVSAGNVADFVFHGDKHSENGFRVVEYRFGKYQISMVDFDNKNKYQSSTWIAEDSQAKLAENEDYEIVGNDYIIHAYLTSIDDLHFDTMDGIYELYLEDKDENSYFYDFNWADVVKSGEYTSAAQADSGADGSGNMTFSEIPSGDYVGKVIDSYGECSSFIFDSNGTYSTQFRLKNSSDAFIDNVDIIPELVTDCGPDYVTVEGTTSDFSYKIVFHRDGTADVTGTGKNGTTINDTLSTNGTTKSKDQWYINNTLTLSSGASNDGAKVVFSAPDAKGAPTKVSISGGSVLDGKSPDGSYSLSLEEFWVDSTGGFICGKMTGNVPEELAGLMIGTLKGTVSDSTGNSMDIDIWF